MARTKEFDKDDVLQKAMDLFWTKGYNATSMQDLVDGLGISRSSMYDTFGDKEGLFCAALSTYRNQQSANIADAFAKIPSPLKAIQTILGSAIAKNGAEEHKGCFMVNSATELAPNNDKVRDFVCQNNTETIATLAQNILQGQEKGEITKKTEATRLAQFVFNTMIGIQVSARAGMDKKMLSDVVSVALAAIKA